MKRICACLLSAGLWLTFAQPGQSSDKAAPNTGAAQWGFRSTGSKSATSKKAVAAKSTKTTGPITGLVSKLLGKK